MSFNLSKPTITAIVVLAICLILEVLAVYLSYEHGGALNCAFMALIVLVVNLMIALLYVFNIRKTACIASLTLFLVIVPKELFLELRHFQIKQECNNIISFLDSQKKLRGVFPRNLSNYTFALASNKNYIILDSDGKSTYQLRYHTGSPASAMHFYNYNSGYDWQFYDD
jgi:D-alanyl-lipoteichoic acid acyltransferase DltB (MBOAT superfamily)